MVAVSLKLTEENRQKLESLSQRTGRSLEDLTNEAIERFAAEAATEASGEDWKQSILQAAGMWRDRTDLPDFESMRRTVGRNVWSR